MLTEQHPKTALRTRGGTMHSLETYEATISGEEEVGIGTSQTRKGVERGTVHSNKHGRREARLWEEFNLMHIVEIGHGH
jgi:hypothetical protein